MLSFKSIRLLKYNLDYHDSTEINSTEDFTENTETDLKPEDDEVKLEIDELDQQKDENHVNPEESFWGKDIFDGTEVIILN